MTRKEITRAMLEAVTSYFVHLKHGIYHEIGLLRWGRLRADVMTITLAGKITIIEVKSCAADFKTDNKYHRYLCHCHRMYIAVPNLRCLPPIARDTLKSHGIGVLTLAANGYLRVASRATHRPMKKSIKYEMLYRMAWRAATHSKRNMPRRKRIYIGE
jgi:hypothetical protein